MDSGIDLDPLPEAEGGQDAALARALGFNTAGRNKAYLSYIDYVQGYWPGKGMKEDFLRLFVEVIEFFRGTSSLACTHSILISS